MGKKGSMDNTYVGTFGTDGWGYKAQQVLGQVCIWAFTHAPAWLTAFVPVRAAWVSLTAHTNWYGGARPCHRACLTARGPVHCCLTTSRTLTLPLQHAQHRAKGTGAKRRQVQVRGKDFRHEKTKKKRGSYFGGKIDSGARFSFKYDSD